MLRYLILIIISSIGFIACESDYQREGNWNTIERDDYTIEAPDDWIVNEQILSADISITSPKSNDQDKFLENVNVLVQDLPYEMTLEEFMEFSIKKGKQLMTGLEIQEQEIFKSATPPYADITFSSQTPQGHLQYRQLYYIIDGTQVYIITFTAEKSQFEEYAGISNEILTSFRLL